MNGPPWVCPTLKSFLVPMAAYQVLEEWGIEVLGGGWLEYHLF